MARGFRGFRRISAKRRTHVTYFVDIETSYEEVVFVGKTVLSPKTFTPTKSGYTFLGWREDTTASSDVLVEKVAEGKEMTLYAVFNKTITVNYNGNGSTGGSTADQTRTKYYNNGNMLNPTFTLSANGYTKTNYTSTGKWAEGSASGTQYAAGVNRTLGEDTTYYACWVKNSITYTFSQYVQSNTTPWSATIGSLTINTSLFNRISYFGSYAIDGSTDCAARAGATVVFNGTTYFNDSAYTVSGDRETVSKSGNIDISSMTGDKTLVVTGYVNCRDEGTLMWKANGQGTVTITLS